MNKKDPCFFLGEQGLSFLAGHLTCGNVLKLPEGVYLSESSAEAPTHGLRSVACGLLPECARHNADLANPGFRR